MKMQMFGGCFKDLVTDEMWLCIISDVSSTPGTVTWPRMRSQVYRVSANRSEYLRLWGSLSGTVGDVALCRPFDMFRVKKFDVALIDHAEDGKTTILRNIEHCTPNEAASHYSISLFLHLLAPLCFSLSLSHTFRANCHLLCAPFWHTNCPLCVPVGRKGNFIPGSKIDPWLVHCSLAHRYLWHLLICQRVLTSWWRGKWLPLTNWYKLLAEATTVVMTVRWPCRICSVIDGSKQTLGNTWVGPTDRPTGRPTVRLLMVLQFRYVSHTAAGPLLTILTLRLSTQ
jgi:hypothetical protein